MHVHRKRNAQSLYDVHYGPNMTPMVDVVMVILIFFMAGTVILGPEWFLRSSLPVVGEGDPNAPQPQRARLRLAGDVENGVTVAISIDDGAEMAPMSLGLAEDYLARLAGDQPAAGLVVLVQPEKTVAYDAVVRLHETCARLGIERVGIVPGTPPTR